MRIIIFGAPGSGKGTQAQFISKEYNIPKITIGDTLRDEINSKSDIGKKIKKIMDLGKLVNDKIVISLMKNRIKQSDCNNGFILDGFPRTLIQAHILKKINIKIDYILELLVPNKILINRITGRRIHISSGRTYHIKYNMPKFEGKDDFTGENLIIRKDDQKNIVKNRIIEYNKHIIPIIKYYRKEANFGKIKYFKIDGTSEINKINFEIYKILNINLYKK